MTAPVPSILIARWDFCKQFDSVPALRVHEAIAWSKGTMLTACIRAAFAVACDIDQRQLVFAVRELLQQPTWRLVPSPQAPTWATKAFLVGKASCDVDCKGVLQ